MKVKNDHRSESGIVRKWSLGKKKIEKEGWVVFNIRGVFFENDGIIYILSFPATAPFSTPGFGNNFSLVT